MNQPKTQLKPDHIAASLAHATAINEQMIQAQNPQQTSPDASQSPQMPSQPAPEGQDVSSKLDYLTNLVEGLIMAEKKEPNETQNAVPQGK